MRDEAFRRIGHLYPKAILPDGTKATVIAWLWARTVASPNPAGKGAHVPLIRSFELSIKPGKRVWVEPAVDAANNSYRFEIRCGSGTPRDGTIGRQGGVCLISGAPMPLKHVRAEGRAGRMNLRLMAVVADGPRGRVYLPPTEEAEELARSASPTWKPDGDLPFNPRDFKTPNYGMRSFADLFTPRQLVALTTFSDLVLEAREKVLADAREAMSDWEWGVGDGDRGMGDGVSRRPNPQSPEPTIPQHQKPNLQLACAYADAVATYLSLANDRLAMTGNSLVRWNPVGEKAQHAFGRQALPMVWDYAEPNFFADATGSISASTELVDRV